MPLAMQQQQSEGWRVGTAPHPTLHPSPGTPSHPVPAGVPALTHPFATGLKRIHVLTVQGSYELRIDLEDFDNGTAFAHYGSFGVGLFSVDPEEDGYPISIADYSGTAGRAAGWGDTHGPLGQGGLTIIKPSCWGINHLLWLWYSISCIPATTGSQQQEMGCGWVFAGWVTPSAM